MLEAVQRLRPIADEAGLTMVELALAWMLRRDEVASAIIGASRPEQVHANAAASGVELSPDTLTRSTRRSPTSPSRLPSRPRSRGPGSRTGSRPLNGARPT